MKLGFFILLSTKILLLVSSGVMGAGPKKPSVDRSQLSPGNVVFKCKLADTYNVPYCIRIPTAKGYFPLDQRDEWGWQHPLFTCITNHVALCCKGITGFSIALADCDGVGVTKLPYL
ncbi:hypothetical protein PGT21_014656 [Puccinia graminis f. sp. tritici]|uniref:Uncharacterized protein n=1 Tax=Puccinia graminis f. sp. tritici TaxID=56615 RepID=A0A5B0MNT6_PUCGR|nr:hypothetical protein PGT21_014656 [Puccinia graminis f. sp. tritici]